MKTFTRKEFIRGLLVVGTAGTLAGCLSPLQNPPLDPRIIVADNIKGQLVVNDVRVAPGLSDHLTIQATVQNVTRSVLPFKYRVIWVDDDGIQFDSLVSSWQFASIMPQGITSFKVTSPRADVRNFRLYIEWGK
ncbi:MAG: YcfL family protein [Kiritimatiellae bacterium]|nr:YcfL family protein [Kiritimatiellia bacterium]